MKRLLTVLILLSLASGSLFAEVGFKGRPITTNISMQTGYTLNKSEFYVGIGTIGFGINDRIQIGTNLLLFLFQVNNANLKISLIQSEKSAFAMGLDYTSFSLKIIGKNVGFSQFTPFVTYTVNISDAFKLHVGGRYAIFSGDGEIKDAKVKSTSSGTTILSGFEYDLSNRTKFLGEGGYDLTFEGIRLGAAVLFGWEKFRLKLGVNYFSAGDLDFTMPIIGFGWRFKA